MADNKNLHDSVKSFIEALLSEIRKKKEDLEARKVAIREALLRITQEFSTEEYSFNLAMDVFVEAAYKDLSDCLMKILDETDFEESNDACNIGFAAFYALSLIYKKQNNIDRLRELLTDKYSIFSSYPLYFEVHARYCKRVDDFRMALQYDRRAINILKRRGITNLALCISYASTVCTMLKKNDASLDDEDVTRAGEYIDAAIAFNPNYPKYYFLKAQLVFLSAVRDHSDLAGLEAAGKQAKELIEDADVILFECYYDRNVFLQKERANYDSFKLYIEETLQRKRSPRFVKSNAELDLLKGKILATESQDVCVSSSVLPPVPVLREGDKYFFVCYSSKDFRSVYCDLIELYKHKIPFKYDERLTHGVGWQDQIAKGILSENCVGVVFFLSKNVLSTSSVCEEIRITEESKKPNFCVNLEGSKLPSQILTDLLIERYQNDPTNYAIPGEQMKLFLNFFCDNQVFTHKFRENGDDGTSHFDSFIDAIIGRFPQITIGD